MCGRFTLILEPAALQEELGLGEVTAEVQSRYNVAPTQPVAVVADPLSRKVELFRWGLIPSWAKDPSIGARMINARSETLREKPSFRTAFARRRCLILADGFYEWRRPADKSAGRSQPYYFQLASGKPFAFAGLWDTWRPAEGEPLQSCTIITCAANELMAPIHERMPVMLDAAHLWAWMDPQAKGDELQGLLQPYPAEQMALHPVSPRVSSPAYDGPECVRPIQLNA
ncbi:MAG: SOS response-associated peptidase [Chloroflexi bacterium]|nr:SOS response-associated peptidase [Chloroflexota bacterium]